MAKNEKNTEMEVQCPFYVKHLTQNSGTKLLCESPVPGSSLALFFRNKEDFRKQMRIFCCDHYKKCEVYRMVMANYEM